MSQQQSDFWWVALNFKNISELWDYVSKLSTYLSSQRLQWHCQAELQTNPRIYVHDLNWSLLWGCHRRRLSLICIIINGSDHFSYAFCLIKFFWVGLAITMATRLAPKRTDWSRLNYWIMCWCRGCLGFTGRRTLACIAREVAIGILWFIWQPSITSRTEDTCLQFVSVFARTDFTVWYLHLQTR